MAPIDVSVIVPTFNSFSKMEKTLATLEELKKLLNLEVIFIDDCSTDNTFVELSSICARHVGWKVAQLPKNSGSAAAPRNRGIELAQGNYVYFLDSDDFVEPMGLSNSFAHAKKYNYEIVRSSLKVQAGDGSVRISDKIPGWDKIVGPVERKRAITKYQSLTCSCLIKRSLLIDEDIRFDEERRIGEDIKFTAEVLLHSSRIGYRDIPSRTYVHASVGAESVTQKINSDQFLDFIKSWIEVDDLLKNDGISFVKEHGFAAIQYALRQFVWFKSEPLNKVSFDAFATFIQDNSEVVQAFPFLPRYRELIDAAAEGNHEAFLAATELRVLIAGHDLKFMSAIIDKLSESYNIRVDQWSGHTQHDEDASRMALNWADLVWVEWMLGASVWYSKNLRSDQRLIIRAHRSEVTADYGLRLKHERVSAVISIAPHILGDFSDRFDIPREKFWLIPNALDPNAFRQSSYNSERLSRIAMVGVVPRLKGFKKGLLLLNELHKDFPNLELWVYGKSPEELPWVWNNPQESSYFSECNSLVQELGLQDSVHFKGWSDTTNELCEVAAVISMSDFEGMQVSITEAFCSGGVGITLNWRGAEQGYATEFIVDNPSEMAIKLRDLLSNPSALKSASERGLEVIRKLNSIDSIWPQIENLIRSIRA